MDQPGSHAGRETLVEAVRHHDLDATVLTDALEATFRRWARWWSVAAVAVFGFVAFRYGAPGEHDYVPWQSTASVIALALAVLADIAAQPQYQRVVAKVFKGGPGFRVR